MIRRFDRFYSKHPKMSFAFMATACAIVLYAAYTADADNATALRLQMLATTSRSAT